MAKFRLRYLDRDLEIRPGEFAVGRSPDCNLVLDDPLVSRRHAVFRATIDRVTVEDLGSRNGVLVNGVRLAGAHELSDGEIVTIGGQDMRVSVLSGDEEVGSMRATAVTIGGGPGQTSALGLIGQLVDKALGLGKFDDAERMMGSLGPETVRTLRDGRGDPESLNLAVKFALRLAGEAGRTQWLDWVFEAHHSTSRIVPAQTIDEIHAIARKVRYSASGALRTYLQGARDRADKLTPTERFALQRAEGLLRVLLA